MHTVVLVVDTPLLLLCMMIPVEVYMGQSVVDPADGMLVAVLTAAALL